MSKDLNQSEYHEFFERYKGICEIVDKCSSGSVEGMILINLVTRFLVSQSDQIVGCTEFFADVSRNMDKYNKALNNDNEST